jgi:outer membrane protein assembly factor BamB
VNARGEPLPVPGDGRATGGLYVVGGRQRGSRTLRAGQTAWEGYDKGLVLHVDVSSATVSTSFEYVSPKEVLAGDDAAICLQASTIEAGQLYTCTGTEVMVYSLPSFEQLHHISLPWFNDVHHVRPSLSGNIVVANAGLEMVLEITPSGEIVAVWNALGEDPWARFDPNRDYRKLSTKPHRAHPNFVFYVGSELWTTRFHQGDAVSLSVPGRALRLSSERVHDGVFDDNGRIYFTTVDGKLIVVDSATLEVVEIVDLTTFHEERTLLGWCRGVLVDDDRVWVGFSRIRPTQFRENVGWVTRGFRHAKPTHIACYDLRRQTCAAEIDLEPAELSALYSILPAAAGPDAGAPPPT